MMDIHSPSCFRPATSIPRNKSSNTLALGSHSASRTETNPQYNFVRSNSYTGNMVVESQTLNFRPMTPDQHPDNADKTENGKHDIPEPRQQKLSLPPEGALTPSDEPLAKKPRLQLTKDDINTKEAIDFLSVPPMSNYPTSPVELRRDDKIDFHKNVNGIKFHEKMMKELTNCTSENGSEDDPSQLSEKQQKLLSQYLPTQNTESLLEAAYKMGLDKSPPTLSPKTMSDTDFDGASTGSPSVSISGERRRRKPNLEDIVRRMKEVETDYYSEDSENEEDCIDRPIANAHEAGDEVDGDMAVRMPVLANQIDERNYHEKTFENNDKNDFNGLKLTENDLNENNNVIEKQKNKEDFDKENVESDRRLNDDESEHRGIPLPASSKSDSNVQNGESVIKQATNNLTPSKMNGSGWLHGAFNGFPMFPFQASPPELPFANFMGSPFDNKFSTPELEKDYLKCQYCERTFRRQKNLENHIENTHHGKSPVRKKPGENAGEMYFKCTHCPYTTKHQSNLYVHLRIHTGERPYICGACGVQYSQSHSLKSHIINKHDGIMSYYIKEKRTRSPRGLGYLATHSIPGESPVFKLPASPMIPPNMPQLPGNPNGHHLQHSPPQQGMTLQHSPHANPLSMHNPSSVPHSPVMSPNYQRAQPPQISPSGPQQPPQMSPHQPMHRPPFPPFSHTLPDGMDLAQKSLELAKLGLMNFPYHYGKPFHSKPSPPFHMNGHGPISPQYNGLNMQMRQHQQQQQQTEQQIPPNGQHAQQQYHKNHNPLQEIHENKIQDEIGAIDLTKKGKEEALDLAISEKSTKCTTEDIANCPNCLHLLKLKMLRMNVVRMLSILVPNLNFEEKGINAEGDSVDDLLRDVIESNIHEEDPNE